MADSCSSWVPLALRLINTSLVVVLLFSLMLQLPCVHPLSFNFSDFGNNFNQSFITLNGDALFGSSTAPGIQLTQAIATREQTFSMGRAVHRDPLLLWDAASGNLTDFVTHFSFVIVRTTYTGVFGDGLAFFLATYPAYSMTIDNSRGSSLGLFNNSGVSRAVAAEFDTFMSPFDPVGDELSHHIGIDVLSKKSVAYTLLYDFSMVRNNTAHATVSYNASTMNLSVILYYDPQVTSRWWSTSTYIDLRRYLPEVVSIGFSAATGSNYEMHTILSWDFSSTLQNKTASVLIQRKKKNLTRLCLDVFLGIPIFLCGVGLWCLAIWWLSGIRKNKEDEEELLSVDSGGMGPKSFRYEELVIATRNFARERKLGEGGFGSVYYGVLADFNGQPEVEVAIKRISRESMQGKKEYISEVTVISRLRHRNLVQLIGYCHEKGEFLIVYQYVANGSLDSQLYNRETLLRWPERYKIAVDLASALIYLHEEWEQCVVHRDLKPSNVMLGVDFTPKLGDFGLARLVDHDNTVKMTVLAGTRGYMAPEYEETGKASKESYVYAFGIIVLEIACGRRPIDFTQLPGKVSLVGWVRDLYEKGNCLSAVDRRLRNEEFDERLMELLVVVGLWCAHPDYKLRPSIRRVVGVLSFDVQLPELPQLTKAYAHHDYTYSSSSTTGTAYSTHSASSTLQV